MTKDDVRIIFNNVADIAVFSDRFTTRLEEALGNVLEGGNGEDHVGALFLEVVSLTFAVTSSRNILLRPLSSPFPH